MYLISPLVEVFRYTLTPIAPFTWFDVPLSTLDVIAALRLCIILRQLREIAHSKHVSSKGKVGVEDKSFVKALATTLLVVYGGEAITCKLSVHDILYQFSSYLYQSTIFGNSTFVYDSRCRTVTIRCCASNRGVPTRHSRVDRGT